MNWGSSPNFIERQTESRAEMEKEPLVTPTNETETSEEEPQVIEEIVIEELSIDGVCGVY
jgi:mycofactocin precursor